MSEQDKPNPIQPGPTEPEPKKAPRKRAAGPPKSPVEGTTRARVTVYPRREILDPQGKAIGAALAGIGFAEVTDVRAGKSFEIALAESDPARATARLTEICRRLLANPVVEDFTIELLAEEGTP